jgi:hypothetical protein
MKVGNPIAIGFQDGAYVDAADQEGPATGTAGKMLLRISLLTAPWPVN